MRSILSFLALRRSMTGMLVMAVLVSLGEKMTDRFLPLFLTALGGGAMAVAALAAGKNLFGALASLPGGWLSHAIGYKRALLLFNALSILGYLIALAAPTWKFAILGALLILSWSAVSLPAVMHLVGGVVPKDKRAMGVSLHSLIRRIPMALGPLLGGLLIDRFGETPGVRIGFWVAIGMALLAMAVQQVLIEDQSQLSPAKTEKPRDRKEPQPAAALTAVQPLAVMRSMPTPLRRLLVSDILIRFCEQIPDAFVVLWCMKIVTSPVTAGQFGLLTAIEMTTALLFYIPVAYWADRAGKRPFVLVTFVFFTLFPLTLLVSQSFWPLVAAFTVRGLKEFGDATRKALILDLAPHDSKAMTFGVYYFVRDSIVSLAALAGGWLWTVSPQTCLLTAAGFGAIGTIWFALRGRDIAYHVAG
jgi:MFS family permease